MQGGEMDTAVLFDGNAETFCGVIIDALKELRSRAEVVTPSLLHQELSKKQEYIGLLKDIGFAGSPFERSLQSDEEIQGKQPVHEGNDPLNGPYIKRLQDFRINLF